MLKKELIKKLEKYDDNEKVIIFCDYEYYEIVSVTEYEEIPEYDFPAGTIELGCDYIPNK